MALPAPLPSRALALAVTAAGSLLIGASPAPAAVNNAQVTNLCLAGFNAAMEAARKTPPPGMGEFTCACFLEQVQNNAGINQARETCKARAAARYTVK